MLVTGLLFFSRTPLQKKANEKSGSENKYSVELAQKVKVYLKAANTKEHNLLIGLVQI